MQAFHNDQKVKDKYLGRVEAHQKADEIVKGKYWRVKTCDQLFKKYAGVA